MENEWREKETDDDDEKGRILGDDEYAKALLNRADIFLIEENRLLPGIEMAALVIAVILGLWLSFMQTVKTSPDFHQEAFKERMARLVRSPASDSTQHAQKHAESLPRFPVPGALAKKPEHANAHVSHGEASTVQNYAANQNPSRDNETPANQTVAEQADSTARLLDFGNANKTKGNRADAFAAFRKVLRNNPHNAAALGGIGDLFLYTGLLDSAQDFYKAALAQNPRSASVHNGLASAKYYLSVLAANPNFDALHGIKDPKQYIESQYDSAIAEYTNAVVLDSSRVDALTNRGVIRDLHGDHAAALADYTSAIRIKPTYAEAFAKRAATYKSLGNFRNALADYTAAIKLDSGSYEFDPTLHFANAYFGRANVEFQTGNNESAIADFDSALSLMPNHSIAMLNKARALVNVHRVDSAIFWYTRAIATLSPKEYGGAQERGYLGRGVAFNLIGQPDSAIVDLTKALELDSNDYYAHFHRGNAYKALKKYPQAIADYTSALSLPKLAAKACWRIAECFGLQQDSADAIAWLKKSVSKGFPNAKIWKQDDDLKILWDNKEFRALAR
jgi:tetratricopeptide (TPR) repeat protein